MSGGARPRAPCLYYITLGVREVLQPAPSTKERTGIPLQLPGPPISGHCPLYGYCRWTVSGQNGPNFL
jgi:hypothetical protein